jgi:hypothetical protein
LILHQCLLVQFYYGEDGIDPTQTGCLRTFPFLFYNTPQASSQRHTQLMHHAKLPGEPSVQAQRRVHPVLLLHQLRSLFTKVAIALRVSWTPHCPFAALQFSVQVEAAKALNFPRVDGQAEAERRARDAVRTRADMVLQKGRPPSAKEDDSLPLNAQLLQTTLGVTSEGFQVGALAGMPGLHSPSCNEKVDWQGTACLNYGEPWSSETAGRSCQSPVVSLHGSSAVSALWPWVLKHKRCFAQDALTHCIFGGGMLPPDPSGVDKAYMKEVRSCNQPSMHLPPGRFGGFFCAWS